MASRTHPGKWRGILTHNSVSTEDEMGIGNKLGRQVYSNAAQRRSIGVDFDEDAETAEARHWSTSIRTILQSKVVVTRVVNSR